MSMLARNVVVLSTAAIDDDGYQWIDVVPTCDKARNGRWLMTITRADLEVYGASLQAQAGLVPVDYDHEGSTGGSSVAAGWFTGDTQVVDAGAENPSGETQDHTSLWARVKWTPQAAQEIRDGRFKRISAETGFKERDKKTGLLTKAAELVAATLTNRPFFTQLVPLAADQGVVWDPDMGYQALQQEIYEQLNPGPADTAQYWVSDVALSADRALVCEYGGESRTWVVPFTRDGEDVQVAPSSDWILAEQQWVDASTEAATANRKTLPFTPGREANDHEGASDMDLTAFAKKLGLADDATEEQVLAAIDAAKETKPADVDPDAVVLSKQQVDSLTANAAAGLAAKTELDALKVTTKLDGAVRLGKLTPAQRPSFEALASVDFDAFSKAIDELPEGAFKMRAAGSGSDLHLVDNDDTVAEPEPVVINRTEYDVEPDSYAVLARAQKALDDAGKKPKTQEELLEALEAAGYDDTTADRVAV